MDTSWLPKLSDADGPKYLAIAQALREAVRRGSLAEGAQLPTVRDLAWSIKVTPGTVARAYQVLTQEGLLEATIGRGTFVASRAPRLGPTPTPFHDRDKGDRPGVVDLRSPHLPEVGQEQAIANALRRMADNSLDWLDYTSQAGEAPLRQSVCGWLAQNDLGRFGPDEIVLTHGGQNAVNLILACCLRGDRPVVLVEELSYPGFRYAARLARAEVVGVEMDREGMLPDALEAACRRHGPQVLCISPDSQNPTTARMTTARRSDIIAIARRYDLQIIEDECYPATQNQHPSLRALAPERVWHVGSWSKSVSAALRFGYVICPTGMGDTGRLTARYNFFALSQPLAALCLDLMQSGAAQDIRARVQQEIFERLQLVVNHLGAFDLGWKPDMPFAWLSLPQGWRVSSITRMAEDQGVLLRSADQYALVHGRAPNAVRLAIVGNVTRGNLEAAAAVLARLLPRPPVDMAV